MLKAYVKIVVGVHKNRLKSIKICLQISCRQYVGRTQTVFTLCIPQVPILVLNHTKHVNTRCGQTAELLVLHSFVHTVLARI
jgi:hypothetical protein